MKTNPPTPEDAPMVEKMKAIGLKPGHDFDPSKLGAFDQEVIKTVPKLAQVKIMEYFKQAAEPVNGWMYFTKNIGVYGTDYIQRALVTAIGLGANRPQDAIYPTTQKDADGHEYDGAPKKYIVHFNRGDMPPVNGFWSLTMYDKDYFFVPNPLNRYTLSARNKFVNNPDGSVDLYFRPIRPAKRRKRTGCPPPKRSSFP